MPRTVPAMPCRPPRKSGKDLIPKAAWAVPGKGHFPMCLVSTLCDVLRRLPIARTVVGIPQANEREEAKKTAARLSKPGQERLVIWPGLPRLWPDFIPDRKLPGLFYLPLPCFPYIPRHSSFYHMRQAPGPDLDYPLQQLPVKTDRFGSGKLPPSISSVGTSKPITVTKKSSWKSRNSMPNQLTASSGNSTPWWLWASSPESSWLCHLKASAPPTRNCNSKTPSWP